MTRKHRPIFTCYCRFKIEGFEVVGDVADDVKENSWKVDSKDNTKKSSSQHYYN